MSNTSKRGFASMDPEKQREIASRGGRAAHAKGTAHRFTPEEARVAGRKGGEASRGGRGRTSVGDSEPSGISGSSYESGSSRGLDNSRGLGGGIADVSQGLSSERQLDTERSYGSGSSDPSPERQDRQVSGTSSLDREPGYDNGGEDRGSF